MSSAESGIDERNSNFIAEQSGEVRKIQVLFTADDLARALVLPCEELREVALYHVTAEEPRPVSRASPNIPSLSSKLTRKDVASRLINLLSSQDRPLWYEKTSALKSFSVLGNFSADVVNLLCSMALDPDWEVRMELVTALAAASTCTGELSLEDIPALASTPCVDKGRSLASLRKVAGRALVYLVRLSLDLDEHVSTKALITLEDRSILLPVLVMSLITIVSDPSIHPITVCRAMESILLHYQRANAIVTPGVLQCIGDRFLHADSSIRSVAIRVWASLAAKVISLQTPMSITTNKSTTSLFDTRVTREEQRIDAPTICDYDIARLVDRLWDMNASVRICVAEAIGLLARACNLVPGLVLRYGYRGGITTGTPALESGDKESEGNTAMEVKTAADSTDICEILADVLCKRAADATGTLRREAIASMQRFLLMSVCTTSNFDSMLHFTKEDESQPNLVPPERLAAIPTVSMDNLFPSSLLKITDMIGDLPPVSMCSATQHSFVHSLVPLVSDAHEQARYETICLLSLICRSSETATCSTHGPAIGFITDILIERLTSRHWTVRREAVLHLFQLLRTSQTSKAGISDRAQDILGAITPLLKDPQPTVRLTALDFVYDMLRDGFASGLGKCLSQDPDVSVRLRAAELMCECRSKDVLPALIIWLSHPSDNVREAALKLLQQQPDPSCSTLCDYVVDCLTGGDFGKAQIALRLVNEVGTHNAVIDNVLLRIAAASATPTIHWVPAPEIPLEEETPPKADIDYSLDLSVDENVLAEHRHYPSPEKSAMKTCPSLDDVEGGSADDNESVYSAPSLASNSVIASTENDSQRKFFAGFMSQFELRATASAALQKVVGVNANVAEVMLVHLHHTHYLVRDSALSYLNMYFQETNDRRVIDELLSRVRVELDPAIRRRMSMMLAQAGCRSKEIVEDLMLIIKESNQLDETAVMLLGKQDSLSYPVLKLLVNLLASQVKAIRDAAFTALKNVSIDSDDRANEVIQLLRDTFCRPFVFGPLLRYLREQQISSDYVLPFEWGGKLKKMMTRKPDVLTALLVSALKMTGYVTQGSVVPTPVPAGTESRLSMWTLSTTAMSRRASVSAGWKSSDTLVRNVDTPGLFSGRSTSTRGNPVSTTEESVDVFTSSQPLSAYIDKISQPPALHKSATFPDDSLFESQTEDAMQSHSDGGLPRQPSTAFSEVTQSSATSDTASTQASEELDWVDVPKSRPPRPPSYPRAQTSLGVVGLIRERRKMSVQFNEALDVSETEDLPAPSSQVVTGRARSSLSSSRVRWERDELQENTQLLSQPSSVAVQKSIAPPLSSTSTHLQPEMRSISAASYNRPHSQQQQRIPRLSISSSAVSERRSSTSMSARSNGGFSAAYESFVGYAGSVLPSQTPRVSAGMASRGSMRSAPPPIVREEAPTFVSTKFTPSFRKSSSLTTAFTRVTKENTARSLTSFSVGGSGGYEDSGGVSSAALIAQLKASRSSRERKQGKSVAPLAARYIV